MIGQIIGIKGDKNNRTTTYTYTYRLPFALGLRYHIQHTGYPSPPGLRVPPTSYLPPLSAPPPTLEVWGCPFRGGLQGGWLLNNHLWWFFSLSTVGSAPPHIVWGDIPSRCLITPVQGGWASELYGVYIYSIHPGALPPPHQQCGVIQFLPLPKEVPLHGGGDPALIYSSPGDIHIQDPSLFPPSGFLIQSIHSIHSPSPSSLSFRGETHTYLPPHSHRHMILCVTLPGCLPRYPPRPLALGAGLSTLRHPPPSLSHTLMQVSSQDLSYTYFIQYD